MPNLSPTRNDADLIAFARRQVESARRGAGELRDVVAAHGSSSLQGPLGLGRDTAPHIPGYTNFREHSRGGQGTVYRAVQEATGREIAIKLLHHQALGEGAEIRFAREVQVLARLKNPHIVTIHDSGFVQGRSYIVMDFVHGQPLDRWMQESARATASVSTARRREDGPIARAVMVFVHICEAIQAAHVRGVIHRDLKPANILVDAAGEPHILDFGLAKLTPDASLVGLTAMTHEGQFVGSVPWASPEQIDGREDLDTRSDVYSLGVLLFHALTGQFPYRVDGPMFETFRNIRETLPTRPRTLHSEIDDELETIVLRCLAKERERRYQTAGELGRDLELYLRGEPIEAKRDSMTYLARKVLRRYRGHIAAGVTMLALLVGGLVMSTFLWRDAILQRDRAFAAEELADRDRDRALAAEKQAGQERDRALAAEKRADEGRLKAESVVKLLQELLVSADPMMQGKAFTVSELLDRFERTAHGKLEGQPGVEADLRGTVAEAYRHLGEYEKAREQIEQARAAALEAYGPRHPKVIELASGRAALHNDMDELADAEALYKQTIEAARETTGVEPEIVVQMQNRLAQVLAHQGRISEARPLLEETMAEAEQILGPDHRVTASCIHSMGNLLFDMGEYERAAEVHQRSASIYRAKGEGHDSDYAVSLHDCAVALLKMRRFEEARPKFEESLQVFERIYGADSLRVTGPISGLALVERHTGDAVAAEKWMRRVLEIQRAKLPADHGSIAGTLNNLAAVMEALNQPQDAAALYDEALGIYRRMYPEGHPLLAGTMSNLARMWYQFGRPHLAESILREAAEMDERLLPPTHPQRIENRKGMGHVLFALERYDDSIPYIRESIQMQEQAFGPTDERVLKNRLWLADALAMCAGTAQSCGSADEAEQRIRECLDLRRAQMPETAWQIGSAEILLAEVLERQNRLEEAEEHLLSGWSVLSADPSTPPARRTTALQQVQSFYQAHPRGAGVQAEAETR